MPNPITTEFVLRCAKAHVNGLKNRALEVLTLSKPTSLDAAVSLVKVVSKLSPLLGNVIELGTVEFLNSQGEYKGLGVWKRQDPDFPDAVFQGAVRPTPGLEIKAWFPFATEITARFKNSQTYFAQDHINVCMLAWTLDRIVYGKPMIIDVCVVSGKSIAEARDTHYHNPPDYLVVEPEDTKSRTRNLQQTNVNGYKWQDTTAKFAEAKGLVARWGKASQVYSSSAAHQARVRELLSRYRYRLDTNFAKMDRIVHKEIETFKTRVLENSVQGLKIREWSRLFYEEVALKAVFRERLGIGNNS